MNERTKKTRVSYITTCSFLQTDEFLGCTTRKDVVIIVVVHTVDQWLVVVILTKFQEGTNPLNYLVISDYTK